MLLFSSSIIAQSAKEFYTSGLIKYKGKKYKEAIVDFSKAIKKDSKFYDAYIMKGQSYEQLNENKKALKEYSKILKINPKFVDAYTRRGQLHKKMKNYELAVADYDAALNILEDPFVFLYRADTYFLMGKWEKSLNDYKKVLEKLPNNQHAKLKIVQIYISQKDFEKALNYVSKMISENPNIVKAYLLRAEIYQKQNKKELACKDLAQAYRLGSAEAEQLIKDQCGN